MLMHNPGAGDKVFLLVDAQPSWFVNILNHVEHKQHVPSSLGTACAVDMLCACVVFYCHHRVVFPSLVCGAKLVKSAACLLQ